MQEFVVSQNVEMRCGDLECDWGFAMPMFMYAFEEAKLSWQGCVEPSDREFMYQGIRQMLQIHEHRNNWHQERPEASVRTFFDLLSQYRTTRASKPEDKVWSLLGFLKDSGTNGSDCMQTVLRAISGKAKEDMYASLAQIFVDAGHGEALLNEAIRSPRRTSGMCSWVPDWSELPASVCLGDILGDKNWFFTAGGTKAGGKFPPPSFRVGSSNPTYRDDDPRYLSGPVLHTRGAITHEVSIVGTLDIERFPDAPKLSRLRSVFADMQYYARAWPTDCYITGESLNTVQAAIVAAGQSADAQGLARVY